nr:chloramphenicol phosphotransferase CPT [Streptomyces cupreus]
MPDPCLAFGVDEFVDALPAKMRESDEGITFATDGGVSVGADFMALQAAWVEGIVGMARAGARIVVDDVFLGGAASQQRWWKALAGIDVLWVGVRCEPAVAAGREIARGDRTHGMAELQADVVHQGVVYDLKVDTTHTESLDCALIIAARLS